MLEASSLNSFTENLFNRKMTNDELECVLQKLEI